MFRETITLTHHGALKAVAAGAARAVTMGVPQCLVVVDASGEVLASLRMDGARFLSMRTAQAKARTAASINAATGGMAFEAALSAGITSQGGVTNLPGGLPIRFCGRHRRRFGNRRSGFDVARAALAAIGADVI
ncbi:heme-binding protein [Mesorhizobium sp. LSHC412B00]|uniref:GlcG/HbpS family heme-binding protein n=1 Tax=unclassified Mesorhizobium TaxID=325217 RepID=UPI0003CEEF1F|nr:heme-binding protein [Mesorhizobium sp. LSHC412B00]ESX85566.1 glcg protein [Mesorhizobium sp. LNJC405B00]